MRQGVETLIIVHINCKLWTKAKQLAYILVVFTDLYLFERVGLDGTFKKSVSLAIDAGSNCYFSLYFFLGAYFPLEVGIRIVIYGD